MKKGEKLILILKSTRVSNTSSLDLISTNINDGYWFDFEYDPSSLGIRGLDISKELVDGYEVNILEQVPTMPHFYQRYGHVPAEILLNPRFLVEKKFLPKSFLGDRNPGDVGRIINKLESISLASRSAVSIKCIFSDEITSKFFPKIYSFYKSVASNTKYHLDDIKYPMSNVSLDRIMNFFLSKNRELNINNIL